MICNTCKSIFFVLLKGGIISYMKFRDKISSNKIIFLDVDGVLNSQSYLLGCKENDNSEREIDEECVKNLKTIVDKTGADIVLSSTWRRMKDDHELAIYLNTILDKYGLHISGKTPWIHGNRPEEIKVWLDNYISKGNGIKSFVILDDEFYDEYKKYGLENNVVKTSFYEENGGLRMEHVEKAVCILERKFLWIEIKSKF